MESDSLTSWQKNNNDYLSAALDWLRLKIRQHMPEIKAAEEPQRTRGLFRQQARPSPAVKPGAHFTPSTEREVEQARKAMEAAAQGPHPPALHMLGRLLGLSEYEQNVLLMCAAVELDPDMADLYAWLTGKQPFPTFALARQLFDEPAWDALSPERSLRYFRLIEINQPAAQPLTTSPLRADERIVSYLKGLNYLDDRLAPLLLPLDPAALDGSSLSESQAKLTEMVRLYADLARQDSPGLVLVQLAGSDGLSKQLIAAQAMQPQVHLLRLPADWLPTQAGEVETLARLWERERSLLGLGLYLDARDAADPSSADGQALPLQRFLGRISGLVFLDTREVRPEMAQSILSVDVEKPSPYEQARAWQESLAEGETDWPARLAGQFSLNLPTIRQVAALAAAEQAAEDAQAAEAAQNAESEAAPAGAGGNPRSQGRHAWQICLMRTRPHLDQLAQRIEPKAGWDDLELPAETKNLLEEICAQVEHRLRVYDQWGLRGVMNRGLGITALFAGESGTGKTMAAEVMARRLELNLYRIDLSAVVSKYIGETEKNLRKLFDAAEDGGALLFFDEADALFGKRSEVKDSHDRYANIEVNYLLQRMEAYRGLAILATNMRNALDQAFTRRLRFIVTFPFPGVEWRKRIWKSAFPSGVPVDELDFDRLSRFNLTGGGIRNAAVNATFLAAARQGQVVTMDIVLMAVRGELRKQEKSISEADFQVKLNEAERQALWARAFAPDAPWKKALTDSDLEFNLDDLDFARLARHELTPASIYDVVVRFVQEAAADGSSDKKSPKVTTGQVLHQICAELQAQGRPVKEEDFQP